MTRLTMHGATKTIGIIVTIIVVLAALDAYLLTRPSANKQITALPATCLTGTLKTGSSGKCVKNAQTMVDFIETDGLNECHFTGGKTIPASGTYDTTTAAQVKVVQTWLNCYNKQEGDNQTVPMDGVVAHSTWAQFCTYAYQYPSRSQTGTSPYLKQTLTAGKDAGC